MRARVRTVYVVAWRLRGAASARGHQSIFSLVGASASNLACDIKSLQFSGDMWDRLAFLFFFELVGSSDDLRLRLQRPRGLFLLEHLRLDALGRCHLRGSVVIDLLSRPRRGRRRRVQA